MPDIALDTISNTTNDSAPASASPSDPAVTPPETEGEPAPAAEETEEAREKKRNRDFERRANRLVRERAEARAEAEFYKTQAMGRQQPQQQDPAEQKPITRADMEREFSSWQQQQRATEQAQRIAGKVSAAAKADPEFAEALESADVEFRPDQLEVIRDHIDTSDSGVDVMRYLAKHPDEAERLATLSPIALARELGRLESKATEKPKPSNAPKPLDPVRANATPGAPKESDTAAWIKWRNESEAKARRTS